MTETLHLTNFRALMFSKGLALTYRILNWHYFTTKIKEILHRKIYWEFCQKSPIGALLVF